MNETLIRILASVLFVIAAIIMGINGVVVAEQKTERPTGAPPPNPNGPHTACSPAQYVLRIDYDFYSANSAVLTE